MGSSGVKIRITRTQELRSWAIENQIMVIIISFLLLCGVRRSMIYSSKEMIVLQITLILVVLMG